MKDMMLLHFNIALSIYVGTHVIVKTLNFDGTDEFIRYKCFLVPQNYEIEYQICKRRYDYFSILVASHLKNRPHDTNIILSKSKEVL